MKSNFNLPLPDVEEIELGSYNLWAYRLKSSIEQPAKETIFPVEPDTISNDLKPFEWDDKVYSK